MKIYRLEYPYASIWVVAKNIQAAMITGDSYMKQHFCGNHVLTSIRLEEHEHVVVDRTVTD